MKANEYVKLVGWEYAKLNASSCSHQYYFLHNGYAEVCVSELKRLVESHELVKDYYGLTRAKEHAESNYTAPELKAALKQAIADVESCQ